MKGLWTTPEGGTFGFDGRHYSISDSPALPKPVQSPHPPIIVGGGGPKRTPRLAATYADEYNVAFAPLTRFNEQLDRVRAACDKVGRDPSTLTWSACLVLCCGKDEAEVLEHVKGKGEIREVLDWGRYRGTEKESKLMPPADSRQRQELEEALAQDPQLLEEMRKVVPELFDF